MKKVIPILLILLMIPIVQASVWDSFLERVSETNDRLENTVSSMFQVIAKFVRNLELLWFHFYFIIVALVFFGLIALMITLPVKIYPRILELMKLWNRVINYFN